MFGLQSPPESVKEMSLYRVVVVDDVPEERELLGAWLEQSARFVIVGEAGDGPTGVAMAAQLRPDLVTLDMSMPGGDGLTALRQILADDPHSNVVIVSGHVTDFLVHATVDVIGALACIDKDIGHDRLVEELLGFIEHPGDVSDPSAGYRGRDIIDEEFVTRSRLAAIVESSDDAIIGKTLDGLVTSWNAGAERLYGYSADEMHGQNISLLIPNGGARELRDILNRVARGEPIAHHETRRIRKDHTVVEVSLAVSPILDQRGTVVGASTVARDITARKLVDAELTRQTEELRRSHDELEQFANVVYRDLSEPLRTVSGYVELLGRRYEGQIDNDADRFIKHAVEGCTRMRRLIDDSSAYSRAGTFDMAASAVDCSIVVDNVLERIKVVLAETGAEVVQEGLPTVRGDSGQLAQLFQNLIVNGVTFARPDTPPRIEIGAQRQDDTWTFSVTDNGIGIEPEYRDSVFAMFQRLHTRDAYPGTGMGLAICRRIVRAHRGTIWISDSAQSGSRFCFTLPAIDEEQRDPPRECSRTSVGSSDAVAP